MVAELGIAREANLNPTIWVVDPSAPNSMSLEVRSILPEEIASSASFAELFICELIICDVTGVGVGVGGKVAVGTGVSDGVGVGPPGVMVGVGVSVRTGVAEGSAVSTILKESVNAP